jgi:Zn-dependent protease
VAFIFALPFQLLAFAGDTVSTAGLAQGSSVWLQFCQQMVGANLILAAFNLLPIPPLDGSKAIGLVVPPRFERAYQEYLRVGPVILIALLLLAFMAKINILGYVIDPVLAAFGYLVMLPSSLFAG